MSEFLFPHTRTDPRRLRLRLAAIGLCGFLALGLVFGVLGLQALGVLSKDVRITVQLPTVGDTLGINSDVKFNGLRVGRVVEVDPAGPTATALVAPEHADLIPAGVSARVLPGTLFGNEYVDLVPVAATTAPGTAPASSVTTGGHLSEGDVVPADTSTATLRLMDTFSATQRLLAAVDPAQWDVALSQLSDALDGRGTRLADLIDDGDAFLGRWAQVHPQVRRDLKREAATGVGFLQFRGGQPEQQAEVHRLARQFDPLDPGQVQQQLDQQAHPGRGVADPLQVVAAGRVELVGGTPLQQRRERLDRAQRGAQVVGDPVGEHFLLARQLLEPCVVLVLVRVVGQRGWNPGMLRRSMPA